MGSSPLLRLIPTPGTRPSLPTSNVLNTRPSTRPLIGIRKLSAIHENDILRVVRALAIYRPSLIALQMPMSEEDEVFVEKCFQRSLVVCPAATHATLCPRSAGR